MDNRSLNRALSFGGIPATALEKVMERIDDPRDRASASLVCKEWCRIDSKARKHVTIALCYSATPSALRRRFPDLESLKLKGKPRASMFYNLIPEDWGGYAAPWVAVLADHFACLKYVHFRRMIVSDADIAVLIKARGDKLKELKLDKCSGFSTDSLVLIARICRDLRILFLEESTIDNREGEWLRELAVNNSVLETLNFYMTDIIISWKDLELLAMNCQALTSVKISDCDISDLVGFFRAAKALEEFSGGFFSEQIEANKYEKVHFPPRMCRLGLSYMGTDEMHVIFPFAAALKKLDLQYTFLSTEDHCQLIQRCPSLEILEVRDVIGDRGLEVVAQTCRRMRRLRIERGDDEGGGLEDEQGNVTHRGLAALAQGCLELEYVAVYVADINNAALVSIGTYSKKLRDFRLVLLDREERITELPLDNGVRALLMGCSQLRRFAFYLRPGALTDVGLGYIGQFSNNVKWMLLGCAGESDQGLLQFATGCPNLQKLEIRGCCFSERALALAVLRLVSLRYIWVEGYNASPMGSDLMLMAHPFWNIEFIPPRQEILNNNNGNGDGQPVMHPAQVLAYYSLAGRRTDFPETVVPLYPL